MCRGSLGHALPPAWVDVSEEVATEIAKLRVKLAELSKIHSQALMPTFDDSGGTDQTIEIFTQEVTRGFKKCEQKLRRLEGEKGARGQDASIRKNVQVGCALLRQVQMELVAHWPVLRRCSLVSRF